MQPPKKSVVVAPTFIASELKSKVEIFEQFLNMLSNFVVFEVSKFLSDKVAKFESLFDAVFENK